MSNDRTTASVKRDHIALMNTLFKWDGAKWVPQPEVFFNTPNMAVDMGNFVGALNAADREQWPPTPPPGDQFADLKWRLATVGSWAAFSPIFFTESNELKAAYPNLDNTINQLNGYYGPGGFGNVYGKRDDNLFYYVDITTQTFKSDVGGAADNMIINQPGNPNHVGPPRISIP